MRERNLNPLSYATSIRHRFWDYDIRFETLHPRELLPRIDVPVLLAQGTKSQIYPTKVWEYLELQIPETALALFEENGHGPVLGGARTVQPCRNGLRSRTLIPFREADAARRAHALGTAAE
jgi:pimeloyl-ACP methyl ester carboxylesterase